MKRIKGRYVAQVVLEFDTPRESNTLPLEKIKHNICDGDMKIAIKGALSDELDYCTVTLDYCTVTVDQQYADVYEVDDDGSD